MCHCSRKRVTSSLLLCQITFAPFRACLGVRISEEIERAKILLLFKIKQQGEFSPPISSCIVAKPLGLIRQLYFSRGSHFPKENELILLEKMGLLGTQKTEGIVGAKILFLFNFEYKVDFSPFNYLRFFGSQTSSQSVKLQHSIGVYFLPGCL